MSAPISLVATSSGTNSRNGQVDPMEDFINREKAALEALEIAGGDAMQIDDPPTPATAKSVGSVSPSGSLGSFTQFSQAASGEMRSLNSSSGSLQHRQGLSSSAIPVVTAPSQPSSPTVISPHSRTARPETATMREWKTERARRIAQIDAQAEQSRQSRREEARQDLDRFQSQWKESVEERKRANRSKMGTSGLSEWDKEEATLSEGSLKKEDFDWEKFKTFIETLPKPIKDCSRLMGILKSL